MNTLHWGHFQFTRLKKKLVDADFFVSRVTERITLMGDDEEVLIVDLSTLYFTLQNLTAEDFFKLR